MRFEAKLIEETTNPHNELIRTKSFNVVNRYPSDIHKNKKLQVLNYLSILKKVGWGRT